MRRKRSSDSSSDECSEPVNASDTASRNLQEFETEENGNESDEGSNNTFLNGIDGDLPSSTPLKFIKEGDGGRKAAGASDDNERAGRKKCRDPGRATVTFFGFEAEELKEFIRVKGIDGTVVSEGNNFIKCDCRCNSAFPVIRSILGLNSTVFEGNGKIVGVILEDDSLASLPVPPGINEGVFDDPHNDTYGPSFGYFGLSWLFDAISRLFGWY